jgi:hypothetical protein
MAASRARLLKLQIRAPETRGGRRGETDRLTDRQIDRDKETDLGGSHIKWEFYLVGRTVKACPDVIFVLVCFWFWWDGI